MNSSMSSMESRITLHNSFISELRLFINEPSNQRIVEMIEEITKDYLLVDSMKTNFVLNHEKFFNFHQELLNHGLEKQALIDPPFERAYKFFLKIYLVKSNFRFVAPIFKRIFRFLGSTLESDRCPPSLVSSIMSVLHLLSGYNFYLANSKFLMFSGAEASGLTIPFDSEKDFFKPYLNREFSYILCFTTDFSSRPGPDDSAFLLQFSGELSDDESYAVFYRNDKLWFGCRSNQPLLEFPIFENAFTILSKKWNILVFSCDFDSRSKMTTLSFRLNEHVYRKSVVIENMNQKSGKHKLSVFNNISGYLSTISYFTRVITDKDYKSLNVPIFAQGITTSEAFEHFAKVFNDDFQKSSIQFLLTPLFDDNRVSRRESSLIEFIHKRPVTLNDDCFVVENNSNDFSFSVTGRKIHHSVFALFNYINTQDDFKLLFKVVINFLSQDRIVDTLQGKMKAKLYGNFLATVISSNAFLYFDVEQVELLVNTQNSQNSKYRKKFFNKFLLNFHLILHVLHTEDIAKAYFNAIYKLVNADFNLLCDIDVQNLIRCQLLFMHRDTDFDNLKALQIAKVIVKVINENHYTGTLDFTGYLLYLNSPKESHMQIFFYLLNAVSIHLNNCSYKVDNREFYISCLANFLVAIDYSLYIEKAMKLILKLEPDCEKLLIFLWRSKLTKEYCLDTTKKIFLRYKKLGYVIQSSIGLTTFLIKRVFENLNQHNIFSSEKISLKKKGMFNLLFDISLVLEPSNLEKILQCLLVAIKKNPKDFVACMKRTNFLTWNTILLFMFYNSESNEALFDLGNKLLVQYCFFYGQFENSVLFLSHISELVQYFSAEMSSSDLKFVLIANIYKEFDSKDLIMANEEMLNSFVIYTFHYFYTNLRSDTSSEPYITFLMIMTSYIHKNVNLNPSSNLALSMQKELTNSLSPRLTSSFTFWGLNSSSLKNMRVIRDTPLKYLTVMMLSSFNDLNASGNEEALAANYRFINGYFDKLLHFLENNRSKLKPDKIFAIEISLYYILKELFREEKAKERIKEIKESLFYFSDTAVYQNSFAAKFLKNLGVQNELLIDRFFASMAAVHSSKSIYIEEYEDFDYNFNNESYALKALGEINQALEENQIMISDRLFLEADIERISPVKSSMYVQNLSSYKIMMDALYVKQLVKLQGFFNDYYKLYKNERGVNGNLFDEGIKAKNFVEVFDLKNFEYEADDHRGLKFKHNPVILNNLQRPFLKKKPQWKWKAPGFPNLFRLLPDMQLSSLFVFQKQEHWPCELIHQLKFVPCFVSVRTNTSKPCLELLVNFQSDNSRKQSSIELKKFGFKRHKKLLYKFFLVNLHEVRPYKFLQKRTSLILFLKNKEQIILNFQSLEAVRQVDTLLQSHLKVKGLKRKDSRLPNDSRFSNSKWLRNELSNYKYIMKVNLQSSRSFSDFSQYPIFPLLIKSFGKSMKARELSLPIGMVGEEKRSKIFRNRFRSSDNFTEHPSYHYGSHYSSPATVFNYMIRLHPYDKGCKAIQSGHFDLPDRLFFSLKFMLKNIMEEMSDVRELIPEFYYLPELLLNLNNFDFGINQQQTRVHNVILPELFEDSPYRFVYQFRQLLESQEVSVELGSWIDLIFGFRQQGPEAVEANNIFFHLTYEENVKEALAQDQANPHAIETQIYHFGQTPLQLFDKPHPNKKNGGREPSLSSIEVPMKYFIKIRDQLSRKKSLTFYIKELQVLGFTESASTRKILLLKENSIEIWKLSVLNTNINPKNPFDFYLIEDIPIEKIQHQLLLNCHNPKFAHVVEVFGKSKIIYGGFHNGSMLIFNFSSGKLLAKHSMHSSIVIHIALDVKYNRFISADASGVVIISNLDLETNTLTPQTFIFDYYGSQILAIGFSTSMKNLIYVRTRSSLELRSTFTPAKALSSIRLMSRPDKKQVLQTVGGFKDVLVSFGYINCFVIFLYHQKRNHLFSISFEGQIIGKHTLESENEPMFHKFFLVTDEYYKDHVVVCNKKGDLLILDLPFFEQGRRLNSNVNINISSAILINKNKTLLVVDDRGVIDIFSVISN